MNPESAKPELDQWLAYQRGMLSDMESKQIENYLEKHGVPQEHAQIQSGETADSLVQELRQLGEDEPESRVGLGSLKAAEGLGAASSDIRNLFKSWPELQADLQNRLPEENIRIRHYRLVENISQSRMGRVFRGVDERTGTIVALKFPPDVLSDQTLDRFRREIRITQKLRHPQIVTVVDELQYRGLPVFVMPWVDGIDLGRIVKAQGRLSEADTAAIGAAAAHVLKFLADTGVTHRDIKPSNLMLTESGELKLIDLGLALWQNSEITDETYTESVQIIGTLDYIAPEQAQDAHSADYRADIYSLGCTLCKLATGKAPFEKAGQRHALQKIMAHALDPFPENQLIESGISAELADLLKQMCVKQARDRLTNHDQIIPRLQKLAEGANLDRLYQSNDDLQRKNQIQAIDAQTGRNIKKDRGSKSKRRRYSAFAGFAITALASIAFQFETLLYFMNGKRPNNLIINGSFEMPRISEFWKKGVNELSTNKSEIPGLWVLVSAGDSMIKGWNVVKGEVDVIGIEFPAFEGDQSVDLYGKTFGCLEQSFKTEPGRTYHFSFAYANSPMNGEGSGKFELIGNKTLLTDTATHGDSENHQMNWIIYSADFIADSETTTLRFTALTRSHGGGLVIDNVYVRRAENTP